MEEAPIHIPLIGDPAPAFRAPTTHGPISFPDDFKGKWVILFSHPADFTPVCTTEFISFAAMAGDFKQLNTELLGLSVDSKFSHIAWVRAIKEKAEFRGLKGVEIPFPIIADLTMEVSRKYGMLQPNAGGTQAVRAVFFIDPDARVRALLYYPPTNGRNFAEIKRLLVAMQTSDKHSVSTPADWQPGEDVVVPAPGTAAHAEERVQDAGKDYRCYDWYLCFKPAPK